MLRWWVARSEAAAGESAPRWAAAAEVAPRSSAVVAAGGVVVSAGATSGTGSVGGGSGFSVVDVNGRTPESVVFVFDDRLAGS